MCCVSHVFRPDNITAYLLEKHALGMDDFFYMDQRKSLFSLASCYL